MYSIINYTTLTLAMLLVFYILFLGILRFFKYDTFADRLSTKDDGIIFVRWILFMVTIMSIIADFHDGIPTDKLSNTALTYIAVLAILGILYIGGCFIEFVCFLRRKMPQR